eukprot:CAMPEP_0180828060 /NCGR_PEP_ID=MMETSP1038_2-20121128/74491_1 /TAXON_ID=632150 /ORGANISM="Azadinium spinosum, Strain 3D9" /LENGTH=100 /DNA_ID=CAMNT_0022870941 /DNA_START=117 /DNA_END=415 /DNA_ORIENTATION=-
MTFVLNDEIALRIFYALCCIAQFDFLVFVGEAAFLLLSLQGPQSPYDCLQRLTVLEPPATEAELLLASRNAFVALDHLLHREDRIGSRDLQRHRLVLAVL